jgi:hypothetical protein
MWYRPFSLDHERLTTQRLHFPAFAGRASDPCAMRVVPDVKVRGNNQRARPRLIIM